LVHWIWYNDRQTFDPNLFFDPATGYNLDPRRFGRPNPNYGNVVFNRSGGRRDYFALPMSFTRRMQNNLQTGLTYTLMFYSNDQQGSNNDFDLDAEWARSTDFQRHTLRWYGIYLLPWQFSVSGAYFFGSGNYFSTTHASNPFGKAGQNRFNAGPPVPIPQGVQDRFDGPDVICTSCVVPRNALKGLPLHRVDLRVSKEIPLLGQAKLTLIGEVFNLFNHANYGDYVTTVNTVGFGDPRSSPLNAYAARRGQLAFHVTF
jgi:hypothetical protein